MAAAAAATGIRPRRGSGAGPAPLGRPSLQGRRQQQGAFASTEEHGKWGSVCGGWGWKEEQEGEETGRKLPREEEQSSPPPPSKVHRGWVQGKEGRRDGGSSPASSCLDSPPNSPGCFGATPKKTKVAAAAGSRLVSSACLPPPRPCTQQGTSPPPTRGKAGGGAGQQLSDRIRSRCAPGRARPSPTSSETQVRLCAPHRQAEKQQARPDGRATH